MHVAHNMMLAEHYDQGFGYEVDGAVAHRVGYPATGILGHTEVRGYDGHIGAVELAGLLDGVGVEGLAGQSLSTAEVGHAFKLTCKASSVAHNGQSDFVNASPNHKWCNSLIFDMHYVMAQESDEVKKETQALMGATRLASGVCVKL